jgi:hypothetical protein
MSIINSVFEVRIGDHLIVSGKDYRIVAWVDVECEDKVWCVPHPNYDEKHLRQLVYLNGAEKVDCFHSPYGTNE